MCYADVARLTSALASQYIESIGKFAIFVPIGLHSPADYTGQQVSQ